MTGNQCVVQAPIPALMIASFIFPAWNPPAGAGETKSTAEWRDDAANIGWATEARKGLHADRASWFEHSL